MNENDLLMYGLCALAILVVWLALKILKKVIVAALIVVVIVSFGLYFYLKVF